MSEVPVNGGHDGTVTPNSGATVLSLSGITKRFGAVQALTDVSLDVKAGEVVAWWATTVPASPR